MDIVTVSRATIKLGEIVLDVFRFDGGGYCLSEEGVASAVNKPESNARRFRNSNHIDALPFKGFTPVPVPVEGEKTRIYGIPFELALAYWGKEATKNNRTAVVLVLACAKETLERRADKAFGITKTEEEYNDDSAKFMERWQNVRQRLRDVHPGMQQAALRRHHPAAAVHDMMTKLICGNTAAEARMKELVDPDADPTIGLNYREEIDGMLKLIKAKQAYAYIRKPGTWQEQVERAVEKV